MGVNAKTITLPEDDWLVIDQALQRMPYGQVVALYGRINAQFVPPQPVVEPAEETDV